MVVSNTTPLINFGVLGRVDILQFLFQEITIPPQVAQELSVKSLIFPNLDTNLNNKSIHVSEIEDQDLFAILQNELDAGESAAIALAKKHNADLILLDEVNGRRVAERFGLSVIGSLGCLLLAKKTRIDFRGSTFA